MNTHVCSMQYRDAQNIFLDSTLRDTQYMYTPVYSRIEFIAEKRNPLTMLSRRVIPP